MSIENVIGWAMLIGLFAVLFVGTAGGVGLIGAIAAWGISASIVGVVVAALFLIDMD